ncbi:MAG TPA: hypothetical protein VGR55_00430 [Candidatus Acidoferrum sp.]|nr:hypothetical protein [Candidatus Acidoferrum sp.]
MSEDGGTIGTMNGPLPSLEELVTIDTRALRVSVGIPHPLARFGIKGKFVDGLFADVVLHFIHRAALEEPNSQRHKAAKWFLFGSERTYFYICDEAGIDAVKLRNHLRKCGDEFFGRLEEGG